MNNPVLRSLADMLDLPLGTLIKAYNMLATLVQRLADKPASNRVFSFEERDYLEFNAAMDAFIAICEGVNLSVTKCSVIAVKHALAEGAQGTPPYIFRDANFYRLANNLGAVQHCLKHEASLKVALILESPADEFFSPKAPLFGMDTDSKFPNIKYEINEAAKCLALGRSTAVVFHLMRILEVALRALHACLQIPTLLVGNDRNWGIILNRIKSEIDKRGNKWSEKDYFKEVYARLDAIKDAWRNNTMHVETIYTEQEARVLFENTRAFMQKISLKMDETGEPKV